jgi:hypothetical protein
MKIDNIYLPYSNFLSNTNDSFKSNSNFTYVLEHLPANDGLKYKKLIKQEFDQDLEFYINLIEANDAIGKPIKNEIDGYHLSPSNLRYIYHALFIKSKIQKWFNKTNLKIIEIGGGYGGLWFYLKNIINDIQIDYSIIDLPNVNQLQKNFCNKMNLNVKIVSCFDINDINENYDLLISNYCISEVGIDNRLEYLNKIATKCDKKFYIWNSKSFEGLNLEEYTIEDERPQTNFEGNNKFIYSKNE